MPININNNLPSVQQLNRENVFIMTPERAASQDIRPLKIGILNIMPTKMATEMQLLRLLGNSPLQIDITLLHTATHKSKNTSEEYLREYYKTFDDIKDTRFDGFIITGAPVETMEFEDVRYWDELVQIMDWTRSNVFSTMFICWAAQAGLYHFYGVEKHVLSEKLVGVFPHKVNFSAPLMNGFDTYFNAPHSRNATNYREDVEKAREKGVEIVSESDEAGVFIAAARKGRQIFITGHLEYDPETLRNEYERDIAKGIDVPIPRHYFENDDPTKEPIVTWRAHANLLFVNWLNYYVYQKTPFDLAELKHTADE